VGNVFINKIYKNFPLVGWDVLRLGTFYSWDVLELGRLGVGCFGVGMFWGWVVLWLGMFWGWDVL
jgi:1,4-dihydroxy-2-naphthoate octaprenyltransferase